MTCLAITPRLNKLPETPAFDLEPKQNFKPLMTNLTNFFSIFRALVQDQITSISEPTLNLSSDRAIHDANLAILEESKEQIGDFLTTLKKTNTLFQNSLDSWRAISLVENCECTEVAQKYITNRSGKLEELKPLTEQATALSDSYQRAYQSYLEKITFNRLAEASRLPLLLKDAAATDVAENVDLPESDPLEAEQSPPAEQPAEQPAVTHRGWGFFSLFGGGK